MPRSRSIKRASINKSSPVADFFTRSSAFIARRLVDSFAAILMGLGIFTLLALLSYSSADPSWNTAAPQTQDIQNWAGGAGAFIADLSYQILGLGGFLIASGLCLLALRTYFRHPLKSISLRFIALIASAGAFAVASTGFEWSSSAITENMQPFMSTALGDVLVSEIQHLYPQTPGALIHTTFALVAFFSFTYALAVTQEEILNTFDTLKAGLVGATTFTYKFCKSFVNWLAHHNKPGYTPEWPELTLPSTEDLLGILSRLKRQIPIVETEIFESKTQTPQQKETYETPAKQTHKEPPAQPSSVNKDIPVVQSTAHKSTSAAQNEQPRFSLPDGDWDLPALGLLQDLPTDALEDVVSEDSLRKNAELLKTVLADFNIEGEIVSIHPGPVVTLYELEPAPGTKSSRIINLSDDIARSMSAVSVRVAVVPGRNVIGIELPNATRQTVYMREMLGSKLFEKTKAKLPLILGKDIGGQPILADLAKMPHLLVAGTTGSGKSVAINTMILSLLYRLPPEKCRFIMIDPKMLELSVYDDIPHLLSPVVTEPGEAVVALKWAVQEMEERYRAMSKLGVRNIEGYNTRVKKAADSGEILTRRVQTGFDADTGKPVYEEQAMDLTELPYIVVIVDEFADLMLVAGKDVESAIQRLAQMARAAGIHLIMATQRPSVDVITGVIKANFPTRISFSVTSKVDSRTILGEGGAEQLLGMGDMLYMASGGRVTRVHGPFVSDKDVESVTDFLRSQSEPLYIDAISSGEGDFSDNDVLKAMFGDDSGSDEKVDELYDQAVALVAREGKASTSFVQRYLQIGYNRAARIIEEMERQGIISPATKTGKREILVRDFSDV
ncbi:MAG: DNA translocase FtsK 4TM domain-containing protein [Pseudomonadota bacterium]